MYLKHSIAALLLGAAAAEKYQLTLDGPCENKPDFEKLMPLLISAHKPLEEPGCFDDGVNHKYTYDPTDDKCNVDFEVNKGQSNHRSWNNLHPFPVVPMTEMKQRNSMKFNIQKVGGDHPNVEVSEGALDHKGPIFPPEDQWHKLNVNQAYHQVLYPNLVMSYALSFMPIPVIRQIAAGSYALGIAMDTGPKLVKEVEGFDDIWDVTVRNIEIWNGCYWFFAAFVDLIGFPFGTVSFLTGLYYLTTAGLTSLNWDDGTVTVDAAVLDSENILTGAVLLVVGMGVSALNIPIQILAQIFGGVQWADVSSTFDNVNASKKGGDCNCNGNGGVVCCCCASEFGGSACECGESSGGGGGAGGGGGGGSGGGGGGEAGGGGGGSGGGGAEPAPTPAPSPSPTPAPAPAQ